MIRELGLQWCCNYRLGVQHQSRTIGSRGAPDQQFLSLSKLAELSGFVIHTLALIGLRWLDPSNTASSEAHYRNVPGRRW